MRSCNLLLGTCWFYADRSQTIAFKTYLIEGESQITLTLEAQRLKKLQDFYQPHTYQFTFNSLLHTYWAGRPVQLKCVTQVSVSLAAFYLPNNV